MSAATREAPASTSSIPSAPLAAVAAPSAPELPAGMVLYRNTDPGSWGGRISRNGKTIKIGEDGLTLAQDDSALHLCGPEWQIVQGEPRIVVVQHRGAVEIRPTPGPMQVWECPAGHGGQRIAARDGSVLLFNPSGYALAPENCGLDVVPGYRVVADGTEAGKYHALPPITLASLEDSVQQARLSGLEAMPEDDDDDDAYLALARDLARKPIRETPKEAPAEAFSGNVASASSRLGLAPGENSPVSFQKASPAPQEALRGTSGRPDEAETDAGETENPRSTLERLKRSELETVALKYGIERPNDFKRYPKNSALVQAILIAIGYEDPEDSGEASETGTADEEGGDLAAVEAAREAL